MKILCVLYDDPKGGMLKSYPLSDLPKLEKYPDGMSLPTPKGRDFTPGQLLGCVSGELGLRKFLEGNGHEFIVTNSKDGDGCEADKHIVDADIVISQPFFPYYLTAERIKKAKNLKMAITAGIGSDHVDLQAAMDNKIDVVEVPFCNSVHRSYDVEGMHIGTVAAGRIGLDALRKMKPFDVHLHYFDRHKLPDSVEKELNLTFHNSVESMVKVCDVVTINCPLHPETENLFNKDLISKMKKGAYIVNTARGKICNKDDIAEALKSGQLSGYAGDVWFPQPAPNDHVWRSMPNHGMTPHTSGTSLSAQARYADGVREILECFFDKKPIRDQYLIVKDGQLAGMGAHSYSKGSATSGSEEAAKYKKK